MSLSASLHSLSVVRRLYFIEKRLCIDVDEGADADGITDSMVIGTSALAQYKIDGVIGMYSGIFNNPFMVWGRYRKGWFKTFLTVSIPFHHTQMDGAHAERFLDILQKEISALQNPPNA